MPKIFDKDYISDHIGDTIKYRSRLNDIDEVENYFVKLCKQYNIEQSSDCTADENTYFKTLNGTTYAGLFIVHPLCFSATMFQMFDAKADNMAPGRHLGWIKNNLKTGQGTKYVKPDNAEFNKDFDKSFTDIVVLPGSNKIYQHTSVEKFKHLISSIGSNLVLKPHPLTTDEIMKDLSNIKGEAHLASRSTDLYFLIDKAQTVHTTHISETATTALLLGKKISPIDPFNVRLTGGFSHINHFCFSEPDPIATLGSIMASPKSGIFHPETDTNWKEKLEQYFEYILEKRSIQKGHYFY